MSIGFPTAMIGVSEMSGFLVVECGKEHRYKSPIFQLIDHSLMGMNALEYHKRDAKSDLKALTDGYSDSQLVPYEGIDDLYQETELEQKDDKALSDFFTSVERTFAKQGEKAGIVVGGNENKLLEVNAVASGEAVEAAASVKTRADHIKMCIGLGLILLIIGLVIGMKVYLRRRRLKGKMPLETPSEITKERK